MPKSDYDREFLYSFYRKHHGNITQMTLDPECPISSRTTLTDYSKKQKWRKRYEQEITEMNNEVLANNLEFILKAHKDIVDKVVELSKREDIAIPELMKAWEILRVELGLPTKIKALEPKPEVEECIYDKVLRENKTDEERHAEVERMLEISGYKLVPLEEESFEPVNA